jgi:hypothetical protein
MSRDEFKINQIQFSSCVVSKPQSITLDQFSINGVNDV